MASIEKAGTALDVLTNNSVYKKLQGYYNAYSEKRESLGLPNPGTIENISKEVQRDVLTINHSFSGLRAELTRALCAAPMFQICHAFSMGSQKLQPYQYMVLYGSPKVFMHGTVDSDLSVGGRFNYRWTPSLVTKTTVSTSEEQPMLQVENDYTGADFTASLKAMNPSFLDGGLTGIFMGSYLQSVTPKLALGLEGVWQRPAMNQGPECILSYAARYKSTDWIASGQLLAQGGIQASYWRRLAEKVEVGADVKLEFSPAMAIMMGAPPKDGTATLGAKYEFRQSTFRAQVDNKGKLGCVMEKRVFPTVQLTFAGEIDHVKNQAKIGLAVAVEMADEEFVMQQESSAAAAAASLPPPF